LVINEAIPGATAGDGVAQSLAILQKHPYAKRILVMYGTNDAGKGLPTGLGLHPGDSGYRGSFKDNMQQIINNLVKAGKTVFVAKPPVIIPTNSSADLRLQDDINVINELAADPNNQITVGPDLHSFFAAHTGTDYAPDGVHPNGLGYQHIAQLWFQALPPE
jgi:lysophospholipase L1-like esterase